MYIMGALKVNESTAKKNLDDIKRHRSCYFFNGAKICVAAFLVIYDIGEDMLKSINNMLCSMESHPMRNKDPPIYLAASHSKTHVCRVYKEASHEKFVSTSVFYDM